MVQENWLSLIKAELPGIMAHRKRKLLAIERITGRIAKYCRAKGPISPPSRSFFPAVRYFPFFIASDQGRWVTLAAAHGSQENVVLKLSIDGLGNPGGLLAEIIRRRWPRVT